MLARKTNTTQNLILSGTIGRMKKFMRLLKRLRKDLSVVEKMDRMIGRPIFHCHAARRKFQHATRPMLIQSDAKLYIRNFSAKFQGSWESSVASLRHSK